jgi:hypothetical protein
MGLFLRNRKSPHPLDDRLVEANWQNEPKFASEDVPETEGLEDPPGPFGNLRLVMVQPLWYFPMRAACRLF